MANTDAPQSGPNPSVLAYVISTNADGLTGNDIVTLAGSVPVLVYIGASWTSADLTFQVSYDGITWFDLWSNATTSVEVTLDTTAGSKANAVDWTQFVGAQYFRIRSGTAGAPVQQAATRTIHVSFRQFV